MGQTRFVKTLNQNYSGDFAKLILCKYLKNEYIWRSPSSSGRLSKQDSQTMFYHSWTLATWPIALYIALSLNANILCLFSVRSCALKEWFVCFLLF